MSKAEMKVSLELQRIADELSAMLDKAAGEHMAFTLMVWNAEAGGRMSYVANCDRAQVREAMKHMVEHWESPLNGGAAHQYN